MNKNQCIANLIEIMEKAIESGDWKVDGSCDPVFAIEQAKHVLRQSGMLEMDVKIKDKQDCAADGARVIEWARKKPRPPANVAFTAGPERQAAYWIEWAESSLRTRDK